METVLTSHLRATYDAAVKECVETKHFTDVYAESLDHTRELSVLSASITGFLAPHSAYREACSRKARLIHCV